MDLHSHPMINDPPAMGLLLQGLPRQNLQQPQSNKHAKEDWDNVKCLCMSETWISQPHHSSDLSHLKASEHSMQMTLKKQERNTSIVDPLAMLLTQICTYSFITPLTPRPQPTAHFTNQQSAQTSPTQETHATVHDGHIVTEPIRGKAPGHVARSGKTKRKMDFSTSKIKPLLMGAKRERRCVDVKLKAFLADVDVDEAPMMLSLFMANLSSIVQHQTVKSMRSGYMAKSASNCLYDADTFCIHLTIPLCIWDSEEVVVTQQNSRESAKTGYDELGQKANTQLKSFGHTVADSITERLKRATTYVLRQIDFSLLSRTASIRESGTSVLEDLKALSWKTCQEGSLLNLSDHRVYFVEGLGHNMFSVGQFCDSDLEVAFRRNPCIVRNFKGVDLLKGNCTTNLYTINIHEMASASPICLMAHATSTKSWLWHQRLSHLNFDTINDLAKNDLVTGLPKFKYHKEHHCPSCEQGKSKKASHPPKPVPNSKQRLHLLHMDLCGPMRVESINGKRYVLVIVDDYSRYTWVHFIRSKDEAPEEIKTFLKKITVLLQAPVIFIRTDNGTKFKNQVIKEYFDSVGISHQASFVRTPQQNGVVECRNRMLVEATKTMLIFSREPLFLWVEATATACYTQNRSIIHRRFNKTPYELINGRKLDTSFLHVFGALCYPKNDREDIGKLGAKGDIGFFIGYSANSCAYRVYNRRTKKIMETMNVTFDELSAMDFEQRSSKPGLQSMTSGQINS
ncbi:retrovirus-related pol polyprotein from transposon TNT 1-94 [Tanacetum coccineum]|uniref:Retrovirus-related pol polyprotein from transposon TNT 1-94 n=1 Tax=Tanacetum coccineum TaxID=301880 RepID=A0ABQ5AXB4_9ASTR